MDAAREIRAAVERVSSLREASRQQPQVHDAIVQVKQLQARRFAGTYADLLRSGTHAAAARFFLEELYSERDYSQRDAQFARIAGAIERLFPKDVAATAVGLARLHALTEELDHEMAHAWLQARGLQPANRYVIAWRAVHRRADREAQLSVVLGIGQEMIRLTRAPGLRMMLRMMRKPAAAAGLGALQAFLETGFDTFAALARTGQAQAFLDIVSAREAALIAELFDAPLVACGTMLSRTLGEAP